MNTTNDNLNMSSREQEAPNYLEGLNKPEWIKGRVDQIEAEAISRGYKFIHTNRQEIKIIKSGGEILWFQETILEHGVERIK